MHKSGLPPVDVFYQWLDMISMDLKGQGPIICAWSLCVPLMECRRNQKHGFVPLPRGSNEDEVFWWAPLDFRIRGLSREHSKLQRFQGIYMMYVHGNSSGSIHLHRLGFLEHLLMFDSLAQMNNITYIIPYRGPARLLQVPHHQVYLVSYICPFGTS